MSGFRFKLDVKSFYFNVKNDNEKGHTPTVSTNLRQQKTTNPALVLFQRASSNILLDRPDLEAECIKNSKSEVVIRNILVFDKILVNGQPVEVDHQFCVFLKEEIDPTKVQYGRIKLHYPRGVKYSDFKYDIDNREVTNAISEQLHDYAFLVTEFELFDEPGKINFITEIIGPNDIPYSKVFLNYKGDRKDKFVQVFNEVADNYEIEAIKMRQYGIPGIEEINPYTYYQAYECCQNKALEIAIDYLKTHGATDIVNHSLDYPYSVCSLETMEGGKKKYYVVCFTTTRNTYFFLSNSKNSFLYDFPEESSIILVKDLLSPTPVIEIHNSEELMEMDRSIEVFKYRK